MKVYYLKKFLLLFASTYIGAYAFNFLQKNAQLKPLTKSNGKEVFLQMLVVYSVIFAGGKVFMFFYNKIK
jgi:hypothetical protein